MDYQGIRSSLKTGDIVLFHGTGLIPRIVRWWTGSPKWSHIALIVKSHDVDAVFCFESTTLNKTGDITAGTQVRGVQLSALSSRIKTFNGRVAIRRLEKPLTKLQEKKVYGFMKEVRGRAYERDKMQLINAANNSAEDLTSIFCSELVAEAYQRAGLLPADKPSNSYYPVHFSNGVELAGNKLFNEINVNFKD